MIPLITLFTDAGFCHSTRAGSWAAWAKCDGRAVRQSGVLRGDSRTSAVAEASAILNGLAMVRREFDLSQGARIIVQSDATGAIDVFTGRAKRQRFLKKFDAHLKLYAAFLAPGNLRIEFRHVPGHAGNGTPRTAVNEYCDKQCRAWLKIERARRRQAVPAEREMAA